MSLLKKISVLGLMFILASCTTRASFPDISDEESANRSVIVASDGLVSDGARKASEPEAGPDEEEIAAAERKAALKKAQEMREDDEEDAENVLLTPAEKLSASQTQPIIKSEPTKNTQSRERFMAEESANIRNSKGAQDLRADDENEKIPSVTYRLETFYFSNGSSVLEGDSRAKIREIVKIAKENKGQLRVVGYASSRTRNTDVATHKLANFEISQERADSVAKALRASGMPASDITVEALADSSPAYLEVMPEGERLNRRAEVYISY